jgi:hypothetical protein
VNAIQELADGTLGPIRRAELQIHLDDCDGCRRLADDLLRIRTLASSLDRPAPPDRVWLQIAGRLRQEGRVTPPPPRTASPWRLAPLAIAASLLLIVSAAVYQLYPRGGTDTAQVSPRPGGNVTQTDVVQGVEEEFRKAEQHYQNGIAKLEEAAKTTDGTIDPQTAEMLQKPLLEIDRAIAESRAALQNDPQSVAARNSLFAALKRKVVVLQDTIALMNQMRKGDAAGAAQVADTINKS